MLLYEHPRRLSGAQFIWTYRGWALDTSIRTGPALIEHLGRQRGFLSTEDIQKILALVTSHCAVASTASGHAMAANLGEPLSEVGLEFCSAVDELRDRMGAFSPSRTTRLIDQFLWVEQTGWMAAKMTIGRYGRAGLMPSIAPVLSIHPSSIENESHSAMHDLLFGLSSGRVTVRDAQQVVNLVMSTSLFTSGLHFRAAEFLAAHPGWTPTWS